MTNTSGDPVPAIAESEATGDIAELYSDIRATLGVPVVNLIWRHLATFPGALSWAWNSLKPVYDDGTVAAQAAALRADLEIPVLTGLSQYVLAAVGLDGDDMARIEMIQQSYERSNAMNMIAHSALLARLKGRWENASEAPPAPFEPPIEGEMPELLTLDRMAPHVAAIVTDLNRIGGRDEILASMYRHLAHWPAYLALMHAIIAPYAASGRLEPLIQGVVAEGHRRADQVAPGLASPIPLNATVDADVHAAIRKFTDEPIGKMITIVPLIRRALPS